MNAKRLTDLIDATWPAKSMASVAGWTIREGAGGGSRVSAATASADAEIADRHLAIDAMRKLGQQPLFMVRSGEDALDQALASDGFEIKDPVAVYEAPIETLATHRPPPVTCFETWPPLAAQAEIWADGGIDAARLAVMERAKGPKTTVLGRLHDTPAGTAFAAIHDDTVMFHAIETARAFRRQGLAQHMIRALAFWAQAEGATRAALLVTKANTGANTLYASLGMEAVEGYHYRIQPRTP